MAAVGDAAALWTQLERESKLYGLDPRAELAVASTEGLSGGIGDQGTSFGPWQLHYGGAFPPGAPHSSPAASQQWAWSPAGIRYAEGRMSSVAAGLHGDAAIEAIVQRFERPASPAAEIQRAKAYYTAGGGLPAGSSLPPPDSSSSGGTPSPVSLTTPLSPVGLFGSPVGTTEALVVRLGFALAGVALVVLALVLLSKAATRKQVIAAGAGFLAGEQTSRRRSSSDNRSYEEGGSPPTVGPPPSNIGTPPRLRPRESGPIERPRRSSRRG